jgi:hypothetical protein
MNVGDALRRIAAAPRALRPDQQLAGLAALALLVSMVLPWYEKSVVGPRGDRFVSDTVSAFGAVSFVEAAVFLVSAGVLALLFTRAEGARYELPGGDGTVVFGAGIWATLLIFWRVFDRPDVAGDGGTVGIQWGFFVAFVAAGALASAGWRMRSHERDATPRPPRARRPRPAPPEEEPTVRRPPVAPDEEPTARQAPDAARDRLF